MEQTVILKKNPFHASFIQQKENVTIAQSVLEDNKMTIIRIKNKCQKQQQRLNSELFRFNV